MTRLQTRLRKLEAVMTDDRGLIPHSPPWLAYWTSQMHRAFAGEKLAERIPLEASDAILRLASEQRKPEKSERPL